MRSDPDHTPSVGHPAGQNLLLHHTSMPASQRALRGRSRCPLPCGAPAHGRSPDGPPRRRATVAVDAARSRNRLVDAVDQGRAARPVHRAGGRRRCEPPTRPPCRPAASRTRRRGGRPGRGDGPGACGSADAGASGRPTWPAWPWPRNSTGWSSSTGTTRCCARPSCGTTPSPPPMPIGWSTSSAQRRGSTRAGASPLPPSPCPSWPGSAAASPTRSPRIAHVLLPHDWLNFRLTGELVTDRGDASGTGYWSPAENRYRFDLLASSTPTSDWSDALPSVLGPWEPAGSADPGRRGGARTGRRARRWRSGPGTTWPPPWVSGFVPGRWPISIGTSGTVLPPATGPCRDPTGAVAGFADATGRFLPLVCTLNAALVTEAIGRHPRGGPCGPRRSRPAGSSGVRRVGAGPVPGRRAHAQPARRHRHPPRHPPGRQSGGPGPGRLRGRGLRPARRPRRACAPPG